MVKAVIILLFLAGAGFLGYKGKALLKEREKEVENTPKPKIFNVSVRLVEPKEGKLEQKSRYLANIIGDKSIKLSTKLAGFIQKVYVSESQSVKKGDLLVKIDEKELQNTINGIKANISALKSDLAVAKKIYQNNVKLYKIGGLPKEKLELSSVALKVKEAKINESLQKIKSLQNQLSYLNIKAPFDGIIDKVLLHEGDLAAAGRPIISMSNTSKKLIFNYVYSDAIEINQDVLYNKEVVGKVSKIYSSAKNSLITAEVQLQKEIDLPIGSSINIEVLTKSASGCIVPIDALIENKNSKYVMVYKDKKFTAKKVDVLIESDDKALIKECFKDKIAVGSQNKLISLPALAEVGVKDE